MAVVSVLMIFHTYVAPYETFALRNGFEKMLSQATWTQERRISGDKTITSPPMNWNSVVSNSTFYNWFDVSLETYSLNDLKINICGEHVHVQGILSLKCVVQRVSILSVFLREL